MTVKISGFNELERKLDSLGDVGRKVGKQAVREGIKVVVDQMKKDAPKDTGNSAKSLKTTAIKTYPRTGTAVARAGINASNWEKTKSLYFQHYGYINHINNKKVTKNVGWLSRSFNKSKNEGQKRMVDVAQSEINKIIKS